MKESALERLTRMFDMGEYGRGLAKEILDQHVRDLARATKTTACPRLEPGCTCGNGC